MSTHLLPLRVKYLIDLLGNCAHTNLQQDWAALSAPAARNVSSEYSHEQQATTKSDAKSKDEAVGWVGGPSCRVSAAVLRGLRLVLIKAYRSRILHDELHLPNCA